MVMQDKEPDIESTINQLLVRQVDKVNMDELRQKLTIHFNDLISNNFEKLVQLLYRLDINEKKLKSVLENFPDRNAGEMIAELVIERQMQKLKTRKESKRSEGEISEDEKW